MALLPPIRRDDWEGLRRNIRKLVSTKLGPNSSPTFANVTLSNLTASSLVGTNASKTLESVTIGTGLDYTRPTLSLSHLGIESLTDPDADKIIFWDDSATACRWLSIGNSVAITTTTLDTIQDIRTTATPEFGGLTLTGLTGVLKATAGVVSGSATLDDVADGTSYERVAANQLDTGIYIDATTAVKGIASFSDTYFSVAAGVVSLIAGGGLNHSDLGNLDFASAGHTGFQAQGDVLDDLNTTGANSADSEFLVGTGAGALAWESGATVRTSIGLGTGDSPTFVNLTLTGDLLVSDAHGVFSGEDSVDSALVLKAGSDAGGGVIDTVVLTLEGASENMVFMNTSGGTITFSPGNITTSTGTIDFGDEDLTTDGDIDTTGTVGAAGFEVSSWGSLSTPIGDDDEILGITVGCDAGGEGWCTLALDGGISGDANGSMSFCNDAGSIMTFWPGHIEDSTGTINFGDENLTTTGTFGAGATTISGLTLSGFTQGSVLFAGASGVVSEDNSNFFWDNTNNRLGIGTATPTHNITMQADGTAYLFATAYRDGAGSGGFIFRHARGTAGSPTISQDGDTLYLLEGWGYDGDSFEAAAKILFAVDGDPGDEDMPGKIEFWTTPAGGTGGAGDWEVRAWINQEGHFSPGADNSYDLGAVGATDYRWKDLYLSGNLSDETNSLTVANAKTAYDHSQIAGGDSVHVSVAENSNWDAAFTHVSNNGTDHSYIDQDLQTSATPSFAGVIVTNAGTLQVNSAGDDKNISISHDDGTVATGGGIVATNTGDILLDSAGYVNLDSAYSQFYFKESGTIMFGIKTIQVSAEARYLLTDNSGNNVIYTNYANRDRNHDHGLQVNPTLFVHSDINPDNDNAQWISLTHDQTDAVITTGKGDIKLDGGDVAVTNNLGLGITPSVRLHVWDDGSGCVIRLERDSINSWDIYNSGGHLYLEPQTAECDLFIRDVGNTVSLQIDNSANNVLVPNGNLGVGEAVPQENIHAADTVRADVAFNLNGTDGVSGTLELDDGTTEKVTLVFTGGILTLRTVAATTGSVLVDWTD